MYIHSGENVYITVRSVVFCSSLAQWLLHLKMMTFQKLKKKKVVPLHFIIVIAIIMVKFWIGIMLHKWTKIGIQKVFRLQLQVYQKSF